MDIDSIRARLKSQGWKLLEVPIKRSSPTSQEKVVAYWKVVAVRGDRSLEMGGETIEDALGKIGVTLGVIAKEK